MPRTRLLALSMFVSACASPADDDRAAWLQRTLIQDNFDLAYREPELVAAKLRKMAASPFSYLRGTLGQTLRDVTEPSAEPFVMRHVGAAIRVALVGDPHPENLGSYLPDDGVLTIDFNDFDAARFGPAELDVLRLAQGFRVALVLVDAEDAVKTEVAEAVARGYWAAVMAQDERAPRVASQRGFGAIADDLLRRAGRDGAATEELDDYTELVDGVRHLKLGELAEPLIEGVVEEELRAVDAPSWLLGALEDEYPATMTAPRPVVVKDAARHVGSGVTSYPLRRYYVLVEGATESPDDDVILEVKEVRDPPALPGPPILPGRAHANNGARIVDFMRRLQVTAANDAWLGWVTRGAESYRVRNRSKYQKGFDTARLAEKWGDDWKAEDGAAFAELAGAQLARAHLGSYTLDGADPAVLAREALADAEASFVSEIIELSGRLEARTLADHQLFVGLLETEGPLLGFRP